MKDSLSGKTILIVDDEPDLRDILATEFRAHGCRTLAAGSGNEALEIVQGNAVDAILADVRMPNGSGMELLARVRAREQVSPLVFLMSAFSDITEPDAAERGAEAFFAKPFSIDEMLGIVRKALASPRAKVRRHPRVEAKLDVEMYFPEIREMPIAGMAMNISKSGFYIESASFIPDPHTPLRFSIKAPEGQSIEGLGIVRWARTEPTSDGSCGFGVEFCKIAGDGADKLEKLLRLLRVSTIKNQVG